MGDYLHTINMMAIYFYIYFICHYSKLLYSHWINTDHVTKQSRSSLIRHWPALCSKINLKLFAIFQWKLTDNILVHWLNATKKIWMDTESKNKLTVKNWAFDVILKMFYCNLKCGQSTDLHNKTKSQQNQCILEFLIITCIDTNKLI